MAISFFIGLTALGLTTPAAAAELTGAGMNQEIRNEHSGLCLDDYAFDTNPGAEVRQWSCHKGTNQLWEVRDLGNGFAEIKNRYTGLCLDDFNWNAMPGAEVRQWTCNGYPVQQWRITDAGDGYSEIVNRHSNLCLDNKDSAQMDGAVIQQWTCNGTTAQRWRLTDASVREMTYTIYREPNPTADQIDAYNRIDAAVGAAVNRYNALTDISKHLRIWYNPSVPTAQAGLDGGMSFGADRTYMVEGTALHEIGHTLGIGTSGGYYNQCVNGAWIGSNANALLQSWEGPDARLNCSNPHIWPYGLNYNTEFSEQAFVRNVELTEAMISDGM
ncbi:RICIN domain-containing protein [Microbacterium sp. F51-2R]|uniref:RICIN domain-containing protein n=1 Tax=Microbacterium sp. F51-2R TaxID=3445777 RepID=UPI003F9EEFD2